MAYLAFAHSASQFHGGGESTDLSDETADTSKFDSTYTDRAIKVTGNNYGPSATIDIPDGHKDVWIHFEFVSNAGNSGTDGSCFSVCGDKGPIFQMEYNNDTWQSYVWQNTNGNSNAGTGVGNAVSSVPHTLTRIDIHLQFDVASSGLIVVDWYENEVLLKQQSVAIGSSINTMIKSFNWHCYNVETFYVSQIAIADEDTRNKKFSWMEPNGAGNYNQWDGDAQNCSVATREGFSTDANADKESWALSSYIGPASPTGIRVMTQLEGNVGDTGPSQIRSFLRISATDYQASARTHEKLCKQVDEWANNPNTASAWAVADLASLEAGVEAVT